jgi:Tol biopolymer transport system component
MKNEGFIRILGVLALMTLIIYILSCRPSWSPDSKKIAYVYITDDVGGIGLYDLATQENSSILEINRKDKVPLPLEVFWLASGRELLYVSAPEGEESGGEGIVSSYDLKTGKHKRVSRFHVPGMSASSASFFIHLEREKWLWVSGEKGYYRVDIKNGKRRILTKEGSPLIFSDGKNIFYLREKGDGKDKRYIIGKIRTWFYYKEKDLFTLPHKGDQGIFPLLTVPSSKTQFAYIFDSEGKASLEIVNSKGKTLKSIPLPGDLNFETLPPTNSSLWDPKGERLWFATGIKGEEKACGIVEVNLLDQSCKTIQIDPEIYKRIETIFHFSLSPDGSALALSLVSEDNTPLCLLNVTTDERKPVFVKAPLRK